MNDPEVKLIELRLINFKCFRDIRIPFRARNVIVGRNNAGKSTIVEALRLIALIRSRYEHLRFSDPAHWTELNPKARGVSPSLDDVDLDFRAIFHRYAEPPARIVATFAGGAHIEVVLGRIDDDSEAGRIHGVFRDKRGKPAYSASDVQNLRLPTIAVLPQVAPLNPKEVVLNPQYVTRSALTSLAPLHFRNQINLDHQNKYREFRRIAEETWPGLRIIEFKGRDGRAGDPLALLVQSDDFVAEVSWMGHGLQMWLQTMWFLARFGSSDIVMLDEPDVYMHPDLQRRLIRFLEKKSIQTIVTTHSVEILAEVKPSEILLVDKRRQSARFADSVSTLQAAVDRLGATQNLQLSRLWMSGKVLLIEGDDMHILSRLHQLLYPDSIDSLAAIPYLPIGGWGGWNYAIGSAMLLENSVGENITTYCLLDSDYHTEEEIEERKADATAKHVQLHIWSFKEIESYLLCPAAIRRAISLNSPNPPSLGDIAAKLREIGDRVKDEVLDSFAESYLARNRSKGPKYANQRARLIVNNAWSTDAAMLGRVPPKAVLSEVSAWSKAEFGASFGVSSLLYQMKVEDIANEMKGVLSAIDERIAFAD